MKHDPFDLKPGHIVLALTGVVALFLLFPALAEMERSPWNRDYAAILPAMRIWMIVGSGMAGFALGWFLSPQASELRAIVAGVAIFIATFDNSALGWSLAVLLALVGFFMALGYWLGRVVRALSETPTTFGSAQWANAEPPPLNWSAAMFRKRRTRNGKQAIEARRDCLEVTAS